MMRKTVKCPSCHHRITITGAPGEETVLSCPACGEKGLYVFPLEIQEQQGSEFCSSAIEVTGLTKLYRKVKAVDAVSFRVRNGEVFGFLGPNGAGKTTTIKAMLDLIRVNAGEVHVHGVDVHRRGKEAKRYVGYLPEKVAFYGGLTAMQNLRFYAEMKGATGEECSSLVEEFGLGDAGRKKVHAFSKGMTQRLGWARAVLGNPPILILDEPTEGLDARGVVLVREKINQLKRQGSSVFVSSHILSEIQAVCDRVGIINKGVLVAEDTISVLSTRLNLKPRITIELESASEAVVSAVNRVAGVDMVEATGRQLEVVCDSATKVKVILAIAGAGGNILNLSTKEPSLEEVFLRLTEA